MCTSTYMFIKYIQVNEIIGKKKLVGRVDRMNVARHIRVYTHIHAVAAATYRHGWEIVSQLVGPLAIWFINIVYLNSGKSRSVWISGQTGHTGPFQRFNRGWTSESHVTKANYYCLGNICSGIAGIVYEMIHSHAHMHAHRNWWL